MGEDAEPHWTPEERAPSAPHPPHPRRALALGGPARRGAAGRLVSRSRIRRAVGIMTCMAEAFILRDGNGCEWTIGPPVDPYGDGMIRRAEVEVRADGLTASTNATLVARFGRDDLGSFFCELAANWRGWEGRRRWEALEQEMAIEAWHDGRANVMLAVTVRRSEVAYADDAWSARVVFTVEAGEQLSALTRGITSLLAI
jgi:hypothetical protein